MLPSSVKAQYKGVADNENRRRFSGSAWALVMAVMALVAMVHAGLWMAARETMTAPAAINKFSSLSFAPYGKKSNPEDGGVTDEAQIRSDMKVVAPYTKAIRTYSSTGGLELVPAIAAEYDIKVSVGAWVDKRDERNERELREVVELARKHRNINAVVVGNETIFRADQTVDELIKKIQRVKRETNLPVTTGEIWNVWLEHPELVSAVDFIAVHILPYWEGQPETSVVDRTIQIYSKLRAAYPGKRIVIAEFGWPSGGYNLHGANPGPLIQAQVIRDFVARADAYGIDYNIVEAFDQPWKTNEGSVGAYWGLFDGNRHLKFPLSGEITDARFGINLAIALILGALFSLPVLRMARPTVGHVAVRIAAANGAGAWFAVVFDHWVTHYFVSGALVSMTVGFVLMIPLIIVAIARIDELGAIVFGRAPRRLLAKPAQEPTREPARAPKVSIHIPAYREQPEMLKATLDAVSRLEYPNFECIVIINNTPDPAYWQPIEEHCRLLGERFKFLNEPKVQGFKAGALRIALTHTDPEAEIIGVIDADYVVHPDWLKDLVPAFEDPRVGIVQAPQDHRDGSRSVLHEMMNAEYAGFFDIGMVQRNEHDAIVVHGTMVLIRRTALAAGGDWSSDTICEDTDLGLSLLEQGWSTHYTSRRYGWGMLPDTYEAFRKQRHRWAYGGVQIVKKHWRKMWQPESTRLTGDQRREFAVGWFNWLGAESIGVLMAIFNILWVPVVAFAGIAVPERILTLPIIATFVVYLVHFAWLYRQRVGIGVLRSIGAAIAAMGMQFTVAKAVADGVVKDNLPFTVTAKGGGKAAKKGSDFPAFWEAVLAGLLLLGAFVLYMRNFHQVREINIFIVVLMVQSLPFLSAAGMAALERSQLNDLALWRSLGRRIQLVLARRAADVVPPKVAAD
ncbi:glycosyl transferase family 2 [Blastochloris tepida]|uniref:Beta-monoglucosyldiacylglycerol synthase n=2 Tax=Blastochloris tepida TaxID=2233851 RepID=A0A348FY83_9HYPH|nr:glycosyl transferase family 2 [Blastochloris tepida]